MRAIVRIKRTVALIALAFVFASCVPASGTVEENIREPLSETSSQEAEVVEKLEETGELEEVVPRTAPAPGGIIRIDCKDPKTFNPILNSDLSVDRFLRLIYEPLIALDDDIRPFPAIATAWEFSSDGLNLILHIREGALWADGTEITANDVVYTLNTITTSPDTALYKKCLENMTGYAAADSKTVAITYSKPFSGALYNLTFPVIPMHHFSKGTPDNPVGTPLGSGLYKLNGFTRMKYLRLVKSDNSYRGEAQTDGVEALIVREDDTSLYSFEQNKIDMTSTKNSNWKKISATRQSSLTKYPSLSYEFLALNYKNPVLYNVNIRKAIACAVPKEMIIDKYYGGNMFKTDTPVNPKSWLYEPETEIYGYDIQRAREYINSSGVSTLGALRIMTNSDNPERVLTANLMQAELTNLGFTVELDLLDFETYRYRLATGFFDIAVAGVDLSLAPNFIPFFSINGENNFVSYNDDQMTIYLAQAGAAVFETVQKTAYSNIQKQFAQQLPFISIGYKATVVLTGDNIYGDVYPAINNPFNNLGELLIEH